MAFLAVGLERGLKREAIDGAFDRRHAARGELRTGVLWQDEKGPGVALLALIGPRAAGSIAGRKSFALKRIEGLVILLGITD